MELRNYFNILMRRKWVIILTLVCTFIVVAVGTHYQTPIYQASTILRIATSSGGQVNSADYMFADRLMNTYLEIVTSRPVLTDLENQLALANSPIVQAEVIPDTELIKITVEHTDAQIAAKAANTLSNLLIEQSASRYSGGKKSSQELLTEQLAQAKIDLDQSQQAYDMLLVQMLPTTQELEAAKESLQLKQNNYASLNTQYEQLILGSNANTKTAQVQKDLVAKQLEQAKADLDQAQRVYNALQAQSLPNSQRVEAAQQTLKLKQNIYESLSQQYTQAILRGEFQANMITVVETADVPELPYRPKILLNYVLGLLAGLAGGFGLAFIFENLDTTLHTVEDIEAATKIQAMANIPVASKRQLIISQNQTTSFAEAFRQLATSIQLIDLKQTGKALLIMSAEPAQGKSTIIHNLAYSLAAFGEKVIVIDCDLRLPNIHHLFGLRNQFGLMDVLEKGLPLDQAIQETGISGIKILTSGSTHGNHSTLLNSAQMIKIIQELKKQFNYVLLDTPALLAVADVVAAAQVVDGLIEVVRRNHAKRGPIQMASNFLARFPDKFVGLVINQTENNHSYKYYKSMKNFAWRELLPIAKPEISRISDIKEKINLKKETSSKPVRGTSKRKTYAK